MKTELNYRQVNKLNAFVTNALSKSQDDLKLEDLTEVAGLKYLNLIKEQNPLNDLWVYEIVDQQKFYKVASNF